MQDNLTVLRSISHMAQQEQSLLGQLALQGKKESKSVKALTLIATMYLPASLLAVCISISVVAFILTCSSANFQLKSRATEDSNRRKDKRPFCTSFAVLDILSCDGRPHGLDVGV